MSPRPKRCKDKPFGRRHKACAARDAHRRATEAMASVPPHDKAKGDKMYYLCYNKVATA